MKKIYTLVLVLVFTITAYSQNNYKKGYFLNAANQRVDCFILDLDWNNSPTIFKYKLTEEGEVKDMYVTSITEFELEGVSKWVKKTVQFDDALMDVKNLTDIRTPIFKEEKLLLRVLIQGKATLYKYRGRDSTKFFFSIDNGETQQLVFREYLQSDDRVVAKNNDYKQKLFISLKCEDFKLSRFENLNYKEEDLKKLFTDYNICKDTNFVNQFKETKKDIFNLNIRPGFNYSSLSIDYFNNDYKEDVDFDKVFEFRFGIEFEMILPINNNKWSIIIEPIFHKYQVTQQLPSTSPSVASQSVTVDYTSIDLSLGARYYFFLNENSKIFTNISFAPVDFVSNNSSVDFENATDLSIFTDMNFGFGLGYNYNNKYSFELRAISSKNILSDYYNLSSKYTPLSVIFGYTLF